MTVTKKFSVLFVCTGNICRSPMAEGLLKARIPEHLKDIFFIHSAGVGTWNGSPASQHAIEICKVAHVDITSHRSQPVVPELIETSDLVLVMDQSHFDVLRRYFPDSAGTIFLLKTYKNENIKNPDVADPIGESYDFYKEIFDEINHEIDRVLPHILELAKSM